MAAPTTTVCLFIPYEVINEISPSSYILGYCVASEKNILINCTTAVARNNEMCDRSAFTLLRSTSEQQTNMKLLGLFYSSHSRERFSDEILSNNTCDVNIIIRIDEALRSFYVDKMYVENFNNIDVQVQIIIYDGHGVANSQLLLLSDVKSTNKTFIAFLSETCRESERNADILISHEPLNNFKISNFVHTAKSKYFKIEDHILTFFSWMIAVFYRISFTLFNWCPLWMKNVMLLTALGQQFNQRYIHFSILFENFKENYIINMKCKNLISAIILDLMFGCLVTFALLNTNIPNFMLNTVISKTNDIVSGLQNLIYWLMGVPAGLKLNIPLNSVLGKFFLYHIYLWESYIMVVQPLFSFILKISTVIGIFGLTFVLSLLNDLISLATIHIYCFYGYATRLYGYQVTSLVALWRLFRGKKWNPLRQRIDSYTYNVYQLYLGTLIFTVLLFLLPTVMVYYFVFTCLRILVLIIQGLMSRIINILTICPLYSITSRILNSAETTGDVYFTKLYSDGVFTLSMQTSQIPIGKVIQLTLPDLKKYYEVLKWKEFLSCIIWGKIVYPL